MFGEHELRTQFIKIADTKIHLLEERGGLLRYRRDDVERLIKVSGEKLKILPAPAEGYGVRLLMIKLKSPIALPPRESIDGFVSAPVEVSVKIGNLQVDRFIPGKEKYALYGTLEAGVICRYHVSDFDTREPDSIGVARVRMSNPSNEWKSIERIVVPIRGTTMYYTAERAYYPLLIVVLKNHMPEVNNTGKPPVDGLEAVGESHSLPNFMMRW
ncbi:DUF432 domain-containing protein [Palaeococcus ferrophilus]|uniref:DUF432 domain-containing protein n=1 Tax=Palaeococcus ferrophilus TaxID=83868 RepID=UPI00064F26AB|nr:DUF432 domain-containing protein [Palaeococcus ferrophilus]